MKPVKLIIEGVNSFTDAQTLDFEAVGRGNLFCISGKTGAGKTTIFDSLLFALYGKSSKGNLADVVNLSRTSARVVFDFTEGGALYSVERTIKCRAEKDENGKPTDRRTAVSDCVLYKDGAPAAKGEAATAYITDLIGLEAGEFKNVYLLEQGEYADFLKKTPAKQTEAVGKIFSLMRFGEVYKLAGERQRKEEGEAAFAATRMDDLGDVSTDKLQAQKTSLSALKAKTTTLKNDEKAKRDELAGLEKARDEYISVCEKQKRVQALTLRADEARRASVAADEELKAYESSLDTNAEQKLTEFRGKLNELSALASLDKEYAAAVQSAESKRQESIKRRELAEKAESAQKELAQKSERDSAAFATERAAFVECAKEITERSDALARAVSNVGGADCSLDRVTDAQYSLEKELEDYKRLEGERKNKADALDKKRDECNDILNIIERYGAALNAQQDEVKAAEKAETDAAKALAAAQLCSHAAAVRAELAEGDVCPVCGGKYCGGNAEGDTDVEKRKAEHEQAVRSLKAATDKRDDTAKHLDRAKTDYDRESTALKNTEAELSELGVKLNATRVVSSVYEKLIAVLKNARELGATAARSADSAGAHAPQVAAAKEGYVAAETALAEAEKRAAEYREKLGDNCGKTEKAINELKADINQAESAIAEAESKRKALSAKAEAARAAVKESEASLAEARNDCPVDIPPFDEEKYTEKRDMLDSLVKHIAENDKEIAVREVDVAATEDACKRLTALAADRKIHDKLAATYAEIARVTKGKEMLNYVAAEYIAEFTSVASEILNELSGGKYTMSYDGASGFMVTDYLNGGKSRKTDTLSGGELFLASLSVAIAIARTQSRGNNAFFFLDEGFGTLDDDLIDTVYGALESLSTDCLVGVISHAAALIERMPACVEVLEATDTAGSIIKY